jgi:hypothetical protein
MMKRGSQISSVLGLLTAVVALGTHDALAQSAGVAGDEDTGECKVDKGTAQADGALLWAPQLYAQAGAREPNVANAPAFGDRIRYDLGGRISLAGIYQSSLLGKRADAACNWRNARQLGNSAVQRVGLQAKLGILQQHVAKASGIQDNLLKQVAAKLAKASDVTGFAVRLEQLRSAVAETERALAALPMTAAVKIDAVNAAKDLSEVDARLRRARAWDVSLQAGISSFDTGGTATVATVSATLSLGVLFAGNDKISSGRMEVAVRAKGDLSTMIEQDTKRDQELSSVLALIDDEVSGIEKLGNLMGEEWRRKQQSLWFDRALLSAESAALKARLGLMTGGSK